MNESEQAQAITEIKEWLEKQLRKAQSRGDYSAWPSEDSANHIIECLEIIDSLAQKIAGHEKTINEQADALADFEDLYKVLTKYYEDRICYSSLRDAINHFKAMRG